MPISCRISAGLDVQKGPFDGKEVETDTARYLAPGLSIRLCPIDGMHTWTQLESLVGPQPFAPDTSSTGWTVRRIC